LLGRIASHISYAASVCTESCCRIVSVRAGGVSPDSRLPSARANYFWFHESEGDIGPRVLASYFNIPISAITVGLLTLLVVQLGYPVSAAFFTGLSLAVSTFAWGQARILFVEPLQGLLFVGAGSLLLRATRARSVMGGCMLALAILVKITSILALPAVLLLPNERGELLCRRLNTRRAHCSRGNRARRLRLVQLDSIR